MKKKLVSLFMAAAMVFSLAACGNSGGGSSDGTSADGAASNGKTVGICMPTQSSERWINDGANMKKVLEENGLL